jgi:hypothetical protein
MKLSIGLLRAIVMANDINSLVLVMYTVLVLCEVRAVMSSAITRRPLILRVRVCYQIIQIGTVFIGAFTKFQKASFSFVMSVRLSELDSSVPTGRIFMKFGI